MICAWWRRRGIEKRQDQRARRRSQAAWARRQQAAWEAYINAPSYREASRRLEEIYRCGY